jgi:hypothetical protein
VLLCGVFGSHSSGYEEYYLLGYYAVKPVESQLTFQRNMSPPSSGPKNKPSYDRNHHKGLLATCFTLISCLAYSSTLKMEEICYSETSVEFQQTTRPYIPEELLIRGIVSK